MASVARASAVPVSVANKGNIHGVGLGLRREHFSYFANPKQSNQSSSINFLELAPENWLEMGGKRRRYLQAISENFPLICHGLSLSIGSTDPLNVDFIKQIKQFLDQFNISIYTEHLSFSSHQGQLYNLLPLPFTEEAVLHVAGRVKQVQDMLERPVSLENISYYVAPDLVLSELAFINAVMAESGCGLLLDVNNLYVNSVNHGYDAVNFLKNLKPNFVSTIHVAGHYQAADGLVIDDHGAPVIDAVWQLLSLAYDCFGPIPTVLERDAQVPPIDVLFKETDKIQQLQKKLSHHEIAYV